MLRGLGTGSSSGHPGVLLGCGTAAAQKMTMGWWPTRGGPTPSPQVWLWFHCHCQEVAPLFLSLQKPEGRCDATPASIHRLPYPCTFSCCLHLARARGGGVGGLAASAGTLPSLLTAPSCSHLPEDYPSGRAQGASGGRKQLLSHTVYWGANTSHAPGTLPLLRGPAREPTRCARGEDPCTSSPQEQICLQEVLWEKGVSHS